MKKKKIIITSCLCVVLLLVVFGVSYALFNYSNESSLNTIKSGQIKFSYTEPSNSYIIENALPVDDNTGKTQSDYFEFNVSSDATTNNNDNLGVTLPYEISLESMTVDAGKTALTNDKIKVYLTTVENNVEKKVIDPVKISSLVDSAYSGKLLLASNHTHKNNSETITTTYRLRAWIDYDTNVSDWDTIAEYQYKFRINVNANAKIGEESSSLIGSTDDWTIEPNATGGYTLTAFTGDLEDCNNVEVIENYYTEENLSDNYVEYMSYLNGYESIDDMINKNAYDITIPNVIKDKDGNEYKITEISGSMFSSMNIETYELFEENTRIKSVVIPEGIEKIGSTNNESTDFVFYGDFNLQSVSFPSSLKIIGNYAFYVSYISNVELPDSLEEIGEYAFYGNELTSLIMPNNVKIIGESSFEDNKITTLTLNEGLEEIGSWAFDDNNINKITIPSTVTSIGEYAFDDNPLTSVVNLTGIDFDWNNIGIDSSIVTNN